MNHHVPGRQLQPAPRAPALTARLLEWTLRGSAALVAGGCVMGAAACEPVKLPHEMPGPVGCGKRDPRSSGPSMLSVAQQTTLRNQGAPINVEDNAHGGKTWIYVRSTGSVFGEQESAEMFAFNEQGLLVEQKVEIRRSVGK